MQTNNSSTNSFTLSSEQAVSYSKALNRLNPAFMYEEEPVVSRSTLDIDEKKRSNLFAWRGQFSPQLVEAHLAAYSQEGFAILDPFLGSGTVLVECARKGLACRGTEINPAAALMAKSYELCSQAASVRLNAINIVDCVLSKHYKNESLPLFSTSDLEVDCRTNLVNAIKGDKTNQISRNILETLVVMLDFDKGPISEFKLRTTWDRLRNKIIQLPECSTEISVAIADARSLPWPTDSVDLVFTSPPYINVFNYHQQYRNSVETLDWDILPIARSEIGSNRKHRGNRFLTVIQYCLDMSQVFVEMSRVCKSGTRAILVVGRESNVRKTPFLNSQIIYSLATECLGLVCLLHQERSFMNRFGKRIYEDILHFRMEQLDGVGTENSVQDLALSVLTDALKRAPKESICDLENACARLQEVRPSPLLNL